MLQVRCIKKHKDKNGRIIGYTLVDSNNKTADVYAEVLKEKIKNKLVEVTNLTLTSDNRLIDASEKETTVKKVEQTDKPRKLGKNQYRCVKIYKDLSGNVLGYRCVNFEDKIEDFSIKYIDKKVTILGIDNALVYDPKSKNFRDQKVADMSRREKIDYYHDVLYSSKTFSDFEYNIDELECSLEWNINLEIGDYGSSGFDIKYERNPNSFPSIAFIREVCYIRGLLTYEQFDKYILGCDDKGRICNRYTFAEWIMKNKN